MPPFITGVAASRACNDSHKRWTSKSRPAVAKSTYRALDYALLLNAGLDRLGTEKPR